MPGGTRLPRTTGDTRLHDSKRCSRSTFDVHAPDASSHRRPVKARSSTTSPNSPIASARASTAVSDGLIKRREEAAAPPQLAGRSAATLTSMTPRRFARLYTVLSVLDSLSLLD